MRFKVTVTHIGRPDEVLQQVGMRFRLSLFWNDPTSNIPSNKTGLKLEGRRIADHNGTKIDVPQVALINSASFKVVSDAEVHSLDKPDNAGLLRWTCEYEANLKQDMNVKEFPYDFHNLKLEFGISTWKEVGKKYENIKILPAEEKDNEKLGETFGEVKNDVRVPDFERKDLKHTVSNTHYGALYQTMVFHVPIRRIHKPLHQNVLLPLILLHTIAAFALVYPIEQLNKRVGGLLAIAFIEIGIRFTFDSKLPTVDYSILIQQMVNALFYTLLLLVIESYLLYFIVIRIFEGDMEGSNSHKNLHLTANIIDGVFAFFAVLPLIWIVLRMLAEDKKAAEWSSSGSSSGSV